MHQCKCGQTDPGMFYGKEKKRCTDCRTIYNKEYYRQKKKKELQARKARQKNKSTCGEPPGVKFISKHHFFKFCRKRRVKRGSSSMGLYIWCSECCITERVDNGFVPKDIKFFSQQSLMSIMN